MDSLNNLINSVVKSAESTTQLTPGRESEQEPKTYRVDGGSYTKAELLWKRFTKLYGYAFTRQYGSEPSTEWSMMLSKISAKQIGAGINACFDKHKTFPPNPMEFFSLCLPTGVDFGLPSDDAAFKQAVGANTSKHPSVSYTLMNMGDSVFSMRRASTESARAMFNAEWMETIIFVSNGGELPEKPLEIQEEKHQALSKEDRKEEMARVREGLGF